MARHPVQHAFESVAHINGAVTAHGSAWRQVGIDPKAVIFDCRDVVDAMQQRSGIKDRDDAVTGVSAAALNGFTFGSSFLG